MAHSRSSFFRIRWGMTALASAGLLVILTLVAARMPVPSLALGADSDAAAASGNVSSTLTNLAADHPNRQVVAIVQLAPDASIASGRRFVSALGGRTTGELPIINGLAARMTAEQAAELGSKSGVRFVSLNAPVKRNSLVGTIDTTNLLTSYPDSVRATTTKAWGAATGVGVGVAVVDTGIAGTLADFRKSQIDSTSRVVATVATNPYATSDNDSYGHGTHVAGIIAGNSNNRKLSDPLRGDYIGIAPDANLVSVKVADENGDATVLDVIYGLQFVVDYRDTYNIRVVNLSLESATAQSYKTDPLDAAAESAWLHGIVVVAAAGNRGTASDAVNYAPGNDPYVISVGGVDDQGTKNTLDDMLADWSSRGTTQDGFAKPDVLAPGAHIVSLLAPNSAFASMCPSCIVSGQYIRAGGTSMAAPVVSGAVADLLQLHPEYTPDQVKGTLLSSGRKIGGSTDTNEVAVDSLLTVSPTTANQGLTPNSLVSASTGNIDYSRSSWSRSSWSRSSWSRSSWSRSSWSCNCSKTSTGTIDPTRSSWSRSSWSTSWTK
jgi:serine protease AprX